MRLGGGHPALELVNTVYDQVGGPVEHDVLAEPRDLVTLAEKRRHMTRRRELMAARAPRRAGGTPG
jgi:hypothetical protein